MDFGNTTKVMNFIRALPMVLTLIFLKGIAFGNLLEGHITVSRNSFPDFVFDNGPTQSIITLLKGSSNADIGCKEARGIF